MSELIGNFIAPAVSTSAATYNQFVPTGVILSAVCPIFYVAEQTYNDTYDMLTDMGLMHGIFKKQCNDIVKLFHRFDISYPQEFGTKHSFVPAYKDFLNEVLGMVESIIQEVEDEVVRRLSTAKMDCPNPKFYGRVYTTSMILTLPQDEWHAAWVNALKDYNTNRYKAPLRYADISPIVKLWVDTCNMLPWCKTMKIGRSSTISRNLDKILKYVNNPKRLDKVMTTALDFNPSQRDEVNHMSCSQEKESK